MRFCLNHRDNSPLPWYAVRAPQERCDGRPRCVLDCLRSWSPPFNPSAVVAEASAVLRRYGLTRATGDRYSPGFTVDAFRSQGVTYEFSRLTASQLYIELVGVVNSGAVELLDDEELVRELVSLERRPGTSSSRDKIDHPRSGHDDRANVTAG